MSRQPPPGNYGSIKYGLLKSENVKKNHVSVQLYICAVFSMPVSMLSLVLRSFICVFPFCFSHIPSICLLRYCSYPEIDFSQALYTYLYIKKQKITFTLRFCLHSGSITFVKFFNLSFTQVAFEISCLLMLFYTLKLMLPLHLI